MSNYNYNPYLYGYNQPYGQYYRPQTQPLMQQQMQQQVITPFRNVLFANASDVEKRIIDANTAELLIDRDTKTAFVKSADQMGIPSTKAYKFEEIVEKDTNELSSAEKLQNFDMSEYVKSTELQETIKKLEEKIENLETKLNKE